MRAYYNIAICKIIFLLICCYARADVNLAAIESYTYSMGKMDKFYVEPEAVYMSQKEFFLNISGELVPIKILLSDDQGIFVPIEEMFSAKANDSIWSCAWCGTENQGGTFCRLCHKLR